MTDSGNCLKVYFSKILSKFFRKFLAIFLEILTKFTGNYYRGDNLAFFFILEKKEKEKKINIYGSNGAIKTTTLIAPFVQMAVVNFRVFSPIQMAPL